jgi:hypothetical protein
MEEDEGNGMFIPQVEDASESQQEESGVPQGPEPLFDLPQDPEEVLGAENPAPPQPGEPPGEVDVPQLVVDDLSPCTLQTPQGDSLMQEVCTRLALNKKKLIEQYKRERVCSWPLMIIREPILVRGAGTGYFFC